MEMEMKMNMVEQIDRENGEKRMEQVIFVSDVTVVLSTFLHL